MKFTIVIATVLPDVRYTQLALYNLKAYALKYSKYGRQLDIKLHEIEADRHQYLLGTTYPVLSKKSLVKHAVTILKSDSRIIGFSCFMWNIEHILQLCKIIKSIRPDVTLLLGGPEASADPKKLLEDNPCVDMIVRDEGEATFTEVIDCIASKEYDLSTVKGLFYRQKGAIIENPYRPPIDLETIPSPYLTGLINLDENMSFALETSRGCPFKCAYCTYSIRGYHQLRFFPLKKVLAELKLVLSKRPRKIRIMDDNFNINPVRTRLMLQEIAKGRQSSDIKVFLNSSMWEIDDELVRLLKKSDVVCSVGVQSINDKVLSLISRGNKRPVLEQNLRKFDGHNLKYELSFILGLPGEDYRQVKQSLDWAFRYHPSEINLFPLMVFKGTYLSSHARRLGLSAYGKPFYLIRKNKTIPERLIKKGIGLRESIGLLYNKGLMRDSLRYITATTGVPFSEIIEELDGITKRGSRKRNPLQLQKYLIAHLVRNHPQLKPSPALSKSMKADYRYYSGSTLPDIPVGESGRKAYASASGNL